MTDEEMEALEHYEREVVYVRDVHVLKRWVQTSLEVRRYIATKQLPRVHQVARHGDVILSLEGGQTVVSNLYEEQFNAFLDNVILVGNMGIRSEISGGQTPFVLAAAPPEQVRKFLKALDVVRETFLFAVYVSL